MSKIITAGWEYFENRNERSKAELATFETTHWTSFTQPEKPAPRETPETCQAAGDSSADGLAGSGIYTVRSPA
jgi:hypothetical protein